MDDLWWHQRDHSRSDNIPSGAKESLNATRALPVWNVDHVCNDLGSGNVTRSPMSEISIYWPLVHDMTGVVSLPRILQDF